MYKSTTQWHIPANSRMRYKYDSYGDELEVNYFKEVVGSVVVDGHRYSRYWVLNENDLDSLERKDMLKVKEFVVDGRYRFIFLS